MYRHHFTDNTNSFNTTNSFNNTIPSNNTDSFNNTNSFNTNSYNNVWNNYTVADEKSEILAWLSPLEPWKWHEDIRTRRVDEVGGWLLQTEEYRNWLDGSSEGEAGGSALFCYGDPGVGKTYTR